MSAGLPDGRAGVGFFVATFSLDLDPFLDVHMSFTFEDPLGAAYRALLFVNGWMMGKRVANLGYVAMCEAIDFSNAVVARKRSFRYSPGY